MVKRLVPGWSRAVGSAVAALATVLLTVVYGTTVLGVDTEYALLWGEQLVSGRDLQLDSRFAPTAHPLSVVVGAGAAQLGSWSGAAMAVFSYLSYVLAGLALWRLGAAAFDRWVAAAALLIFVISAGMMRSALVSPNDMLYLAALLHAVRAGMPNPRVGGPVLWPLAVAGLLRPEAWALAGAYLVFLWLDPERRRPLHLLAVALPVSAWLVLGWFGASDPLFALTGTQRLRELAGRPTGFVDSITNLPELSREVVPRGVALTGVLGVILSLRSRCRHLAWPISAAAACFVLFLALMAAGFSMSSRYLVPTLALLTLFAGATLAGWHTAESGRPTWLAAAAVCGLVLLASAVDQGREHGRLLAWAEREALVWDELQSLLVTHRRAGDCGSVTISGPLSWHGHVARLLDVPAGALGDAMVDRPAYGLHIVPASHANWLALTAGAPWATRTPLPPMGARRVGTTASWSAWQLCPGSPA